MLQELRIRNLALLESMHLNFPGKENGLVVFTGETGAGKSIILQAIHLLTGGRGSSAWIRNDCEQAVVEAFFSLGSHHDGIRAFLQEYDLESGDECLIRRVLNRKGRSRLFINDRSVTTRLAAELTENLVNIASQHDHQQLLQARKHLDYLDSYGELWEQRTDFGRLFKKWQKLSSRLRELQEKEQDKEQHRDFLQYQLQEIHEIDPVPGEDEQLLRERDRLKASATLSALARNSYQLLQSKVVEHLTTIRKNMEQAAELDPEVRELAQRISSSCYEVEDLEGALRRYRDVLPTDISRIEEISTRLAQLKQLQRKYGPELEDVLIFADRAEKELEALAGLEEELDELELALEEVGTEALLKAAELTEARRQAGKKFAVAMESELTSLQFSQAVFEVALENSKGQGMAGVKTSGQDQVEFLFSANPGEPARPLVKVVSGGELSRLMLAMKCMLARRDQVDTVIFDEVDAGIGGQAAEAVGMKIRELAGHHQVFCITHLPQIASHATTHYMVEKSVTHGRTSTTIRLLNKEERVQELARMLGGEHPTEQTLGLARELVEKNG
jgi:DNA repair protein RecN (Recombination protein N)